MVAVEFALAGKPPFRVEVARDPAGPAPEPVEEGKHSFGWTARHDGGALEAGAGAGHYANLVLALEAAKDQCEAYMKPVIEARSALRPASGPAGAAAKRPKTGVDE